MKIIIPKIEFGSTGHKSTRTIFGGASLWDVDQNTADEVLNLLKYYGINHIDTAASYGDSELRIGEWMKDDRDNFFLATKTEERTYEEAKKQINESRKRLNVDQIDLIQLHNLVDMEEWKTAFGENGALKAAIEAKETGLVKYIGVTGHGLEAPKMHIRSLEEFEFDSVLLPLNYPLMKNDRYSNKFHELLEICEERNVAVQTIKSIAKGHWGEKEETRNTWYEPLESQAEIDRAVHWILSHEDVFLNTVGDIDLLPKVLKAAERFEGPPSEEEMEKQMDRLEMEALWPE